MTQPNGQTKTDEDFSSKQQDEQGVNKSKDRVQTMFSEIADKYDRMNHLLSMNVDYYWRRRTVRKTAPEPEGPILDLCTGTGDLAFAYYKYIQKKGRKTNRPVAPLVGADFCKEMLDVAEVKKEKLGIQTGLSFVEADAMNLPFDDEQFQLISVAFGLRNVADTDAGLREMVRVCRPGGQLAVLEFSMPRWQPMKFFYQWYFKNILPRIGQLFAKNQQSAYQYLPDSVQTFPAYEALAQKMKKAGLRHVTFYPLTFGISTLYIGTK
ncbi:MAG: bifunctional demethylmenaquinone methyltransferase/2-methoxy-6-polyprenyl-1,4-benzoquinol methylase UbiE [Pirellulaceae bacterium]|nr:bifunctional demethylmenaquinone methyltransferase/2-methoxy-6-polyprenyl-1,4-benzoquinol methylase UbiE [Pirellulaceae bacterium]